MEYTKINGQIRLCAWETPAGNRRPYLCSHHEYCCALGCCVSSTFSFYQLWYFWLLLLLLILLCSGGGWWYRFRHGGWSHQGTPVPGGRGRRNGRRGHGANHGANPGQRVYPNYNYDYTLPPGYDKGEFCMP
ncbi:hypothetical protein Pcinc_025580 [Petrolisthes cinctipes]|uniref:WW domain binding protein VOPP1 n=1 Tax=Petrolisthes cinctipes TaxID=88211 RepID=A0AAE1KCU1_PETCI|nr:hypothetical protein Pcinc_025580 [Petrolisthes cinctipes]